jgi:hypothetical protein
MIINIDLKQFRYGIAKLCRVASSDVSGNYASQLKLTAKKDVLYIAAINENRTQNLAVKFDNSVCSIQEEGICCVPAKTLQQIIDLTIGDTVEISTKNNLVNIKPLPSKRNDEQQIVEGIDASKWIGSDTIKTGIVEFKMSRDFLLDVSRFISSSCSGDKSKAPLTAIHVNIFPDGKVQCTATDYMAKLSLYDTNAGVEFKEPIEKNLILMLPVDAARKITQIFDKNIDVFSVKTNGKKIVVSGGNTLFSFATEIGVNKYPVLRSYVATDSIFACEVNLAELSRVVGLVSAIGPQEACTIEFNSENIVISSKSQNNFSRQVLDLESKNTYDSLPLVAAVAMSDFIEALNIPTSEKVSIGIVSLISNPNINFLEIQQSEANDYHWRHIIFTARSEDEKDTT